jgi:hypothetical protein
MHRERWFALWIVAGMAWVIPIGARAQVDWGDLLADDAAKPVAHAQPAQPHGAAPPQAPQPAARKAIASAPQPSRRSAAQRPRSAPRARVAKPKPSRPVAQARPRSAPDQAREFPAVPEVAPAQFDRHSGLQPADQPRG